MGEILRYGLVLVSCIAGGAGGLYYSSQPTNMRIYMMNNGKAPLRSGDPTWKYKSALEKNKDKVSSSGMSAILGGDNFDHPTDQQAENLRDYCISNFRKHPRYASETIRSNLETFCVY